MQSQLCSKSHTKLSWCRNTCITNYLPGGGRITVLSIFVRSYAPFPVLYFLCTHFGLDEYNRNVLILQLKLSLKFWRATRNFWRLRLSFTAQELEGSNGCRERELISLWHTYLHTHTINVMCSSILCTIRMSPRATPRISLLKTSWASHDNANAKLHCLNHVSMCPHNHAIITFHSVNCFLLK